MKTNFRRELAEIEAELDEIELLLERGGLGQFGRESLLGCKQRLIGRMGDVMDAETIARYKEMKNAEKRNQ